MSSACNVCDNAVTDNDDAVCCSGFCSRVFHPFCVKLDKTALVYLKNDTGLTWKCTICRKVSLTNKLASVIEGKCNQILNDFETSITKLKDEFLESTLNKFAEISPNINLSKKSTYANIAASSNQILVKPKNVEQTVQVTKSDVWSQIDPVGSQININKVKSVKDGGIVVGCSTRDNVNKFLSLANSTLADTYNVLELKTTRPKVRLVGLSDNLSEPALINLLRNQNGDIFSLNTFVKLIECKNLKKDKSIFQATIQIDVATYTRLIDKGYILIGLDGCSIFDAISINRCYTCNGFNHSSKHCSGNNIQSCPRCAGKHILKECTASPDQLKCVNCSLLSKKYSSVNSNHAVWDYSVCTAYKKAVAKLKLDVFGLKDD